MLMSATRLVDRLKGTAVKVGTEGVRLVVEGTVTAVKVMDRLQELLPDRERVMRVMREPVRGAGRFQVEVPAPERPIPARPVEARPVKSRRPQKEPSAEARATAELVLAEVEAVHERLKEARPARHPLKVRADVELPEYTPKRRKAAQASGRKTTSAEASPKRVTARPGLKAKRGQKLRH
ncbi:hypothetical protein [Archangium sp.]|jgi:hypothetical protein|uniref:hypothetical protein n=1 Tax=Archangium sp. TaxID=1872627 RepID=UPI002EDB20D1